MKPTADPLTAEQLELVEGCLGLVRALAWKIHQKLGRRVELDDLISFGQMGLIQAAQRYEPTWGTRFTTYAYQRIRGAIYDGLKQLPWFSAAAFHGHRYEHTARDMLANEATPAEAPATSLQDDAGWFVDISTRLSIVYVLCADEDALGACLADPRALSPDETAALAEERARVRDLLEQLPRLQRQLLRHVYFDGDTLTAAGARLGINKVKASRQHAEAIRRLAAGLGAPHA